MRVAGGTGFARLHSRPARPAVQKFTPTKLRIVAGNMGGRKISVQRRSRDPAHEGEDSGSRIQLVGGYLHDTFSPSTCSVERASCDGVQSVSRGSVGGVILELSRPAVTAIVDEPQAAEAGKHHYGS